MYYSPAPQHASFFDQALDTPVITSPGRRIKKRWWAGASLVLAGIIGFGWWGNSHLLSSSPNHPVTLGQTTASATPEPNSLTFGDLLKETPSYAGWLAGVNQGSIVLVQPQTGAILPVITATNAWYGPISELVWSPDHTHLAYLTMPTEDAAGLTANSATFSQKMGLPSISSASSFPFGLLTILDISAKQAHQTSLEIRNTPQSMVWLDNDSVAAIGQTVVAYDLADNQVTPLSAAGNTAAGEQLQSPLVWDGQGQKLYFTKVRQEDSGVSVRLAMAMSVKTTELTEVQLIKSGDFADVTTSQGVGLALSSDGSRLALTTDQGLAYITLADGGVHALPYNDDWVWLKQSSLSELKWLAPDKLAFTSLAADGSKVWGVWNIPQASVATFGKGSIAGSWNSASGRLALVEPAGQSIGILTPNWIDPVGSPLQVLPLQWEAVSW